MSYLSSAAPPSEERFQLERPVGRGPSGVVFAAVDRRTGRSCALKRLYPQFHEESLLERLQGDVAAVAALGHPGILVPAEVGREADGNLFLRSALHPGESLRTRLARSGAAPAEALEVLRALCQALAAAHGAGVFHGDLTPANVLLPRQHQDDPDLADDGGEAPVQLTDFGMHHLTGATFSELSAGYLPPEVYRGEQPRASLAADLFALGALTFEALHGRSLFGAADVAAVIYQVCTAPLPAVTAVPAPLRPRLAAVLAMACNKGPGVRFDSVEAFFRAVESVLGAAGPATPAHRVTLRSPTPSHPLRWTSMVLWCCAGGAVMALLLLSARSALGPAAPPRAAAPPARDLRAVEPARDLQVLASAPPAAEVGAPGDQELERLLSAARDQLDRRDATGALSQVESLLRRLPADAPQRERAKALRSAAEDALRVDLIYEGFRRAAGRGDLDTAVALHRELPPGSPAHQESLPAYQLLRDRALTAHLRLFEEAQRAGQCAQAFHQLELLRPLAPADLSTLERRLRACQPPPVHDPFAPRRTAPVAPNGRTVDLKDPFGARPIRVHLKDPFR